MKSFLIAPMTVLLALSLLGSIGPLAPSHCLMAQGTTPPPASNPNHEEPGPGVTCVHDEKDPAHNCACHRECKQNTDEEGNPAQGGYLAEDSRCRVYCFKDHCHCPVHNCD